jgi:uncharacterized protein with ATP-grasp and redox domains
MELTTTQVSLIAALIALAAPAITYRASARLDRDRWVRERRAETYVDALAVLGRIAAYVAEPDTRPDPYKAVPGHQWRQFQARVEAFASTAVIALRDSLLTAWERYRAAVAAAAAAGNAEDAAVHRKEAEDHRAEIRTLYADLISVVREELKQDGDPWWRRIGTRKRAG